MQNVKFSLLVIKLKQYFPCMQIWLSFLKCRGLTGKCIKYTIYVDAYEQCEKNIYSYASFQNLGTMAQTSLLLRLIQGILFFWIDPIPDMALLTVQYFHTHFETHSVYFPTVYTSSYDNPIFTMFTPYSTPRSSHCTVLLPWVLPSVNPCTVYSVHTLPSSTLPVQWKP